MKTTATVKLTAAVGIAGELVRAGTIVTIPEEAAKNLLHRGKAELATEADELVLDSDELEALEAQQAEADSDEPEAATAKPATPAKKK